MEKTNDENSTNPALNKADVTSSAVTYTEQEMIDCFTAGVKFARDMMNNPSNSEYMQIVNEKRKA